MTDIKTFGLFALTALAELIGCYLPYLWLREGKTIWLLIPGALSLAAFVWLLTLHPTAVGRVYAAYGGVYVAMAILWLWTVNGIRPTVWDLVGAAVALYPLGRPDQKIASQLSWVASAAKVKNRQSPVKFLSMRARVPPADVARYQLVPGQRFSTQVFLLRAPRAISVANVAIEQRDGRYFVKVRQGGDFVPRAVELGVRGTARSQVLKGLSAGEEVLLSMGGDAKAVLKPGDEQTGDQSDSGNQGSAEGDGT